MDLQARTPIPVEDGETKVGRFFIIPPKEMVGDELRLARLEQYLDTEFPDLQFVMAGPHVPTGPNPAVGIIKPHEMTTEPTAPAEAAMIGRVLDAVTLFVNYGQRMH